MQYPLISEYVCAMQDPTGNLDQLAHLVPVLDDHGEPMRSSGAFAVVFKMKDESTGKEYALKCFTEEQEGRAEAYRQIADELESVDSTYVTSVKYLEKELFVDCAGDDHEFPVLLMDWIDGETMDHYISESRYDNYAMSMLCYRFCKMAAWLRSQPFAHGDIKPDNIMVRPDGSLTLIDYDGMFVPSMKCQTSPTIGTKDFSHPLRTKEDFDETIDDFSLATIALSLKAISLSPSLFDEYASADRLLFSAGDYRDLSQSKVLTALHPLMTDPELNTLLSLFLLAHATKSLSMVSFRLFSVSKPEYIPAILSTKVTDEDLAEAIEDEYGVKYSKDGKRLLEAQYIEGEYRIRKGTICICDSAFRVRCYSDHYDYPYPLTSQECYENFYDCSRLTRLVVPHSVTLIGESAFRGCSSLTDLVIPNGVTEIRKEVFFGCRGLKSIKIPTGVTSIGERAFFNCDSLKSVEIPTGVTSIGESAFEKCSDLTNLVIPIGVKEIGAEAFFGCIRLTSIVIPEGATIVGESAFRKCSSLTSVVIPFGVTVIEKETFRECSRLTDIEVPESVTVIGEGSFRGCSSLTSVVIPFGVTVIEKETFRECSRLTDIEVPESVTVIGEGSFRGCSSLTSVVIPFGVTVIEKETFRECSGLTEIKVPDSVTAIGEGSFRGCSGLADIAIPNSVTTIGKDSFRYCYGLTNVAIPNCLKVIGDGAFLRCSSLTRIEIPAGVTTIGMGSFLGCSVLTNIIIPAGVKEIGEEAFFGCRALTSIVIPIGVTTIDIGTFCGCSGLTDIVIPDGVKEIRRNAFFGCRSLTRIAIPLGVTAIGEEAFLNCSKLTDIVIPDSVTEIGRGAFYGCVLPETVKLELIDKFGELVFFNNIFAMQISHYDISTY